MAYFDIASLSRDTDFLLRVAAAYSVEGGAVNPDQWATEHAWDMASAPGFGDAYASAIAAGNETPGRDPAVITDAMILSEMQALVSAETAPDEGES